MSFHVFYITTMIVIICSGSGKTSMLMALLGGFGSCFVNHITFNNQKNV